MMRCMGAVINHCIFYEVNIEGRVTWFNKTVGHKGTS